jgi:hypothetical protein
VGRGEVPYVAGQHKGEQQRQEENPQENDCQPRPPTGTLRFSARKTPFSRVLQ